MNVLLCYPGLLLRTSPLKCLCGHYCRRARAGGRALHVLSLKERGIPVWVSLKWCRITPPSRRTGTDAFRHRNCSRAVRGVRVAVSERRLIMKFLSPESRTRHGVRVSRFKVSVVSGGESIEWSATSQLRGDNSIVVTGELCNPVRVALAEQSVPGCPIPIRTRLMTWNLRTARRLGWVITTSLWWTIKAV